MKLLHPWNYMEEKFGMDTAEPCKEKHPGLDHKWLPPPPHSPIPQQSSLPIYFFSLVTMLIFLYASLSRLTDWSEMSTVPICLTLFIIPLYFLCLRKLINCSEMQCCGEKIFNFGSSSDSTFFHYFGSSSGSKYGSVSSYLKNGSIFWFNNKKSKRQFYKSNIIRNVSQLW